MNRRGFLKFLGVAPAVAAVPQEPTKAPTMSALPCAYCAKPVQLQGAQQGTTVLCPPCSNRSLVVDLAEMERECGRIEPETLGRSARTNNRYPYTFREIKA